MTTTNSTVLDRLLQAGITEDRAKQHLHERWVRVDGEITTDPARAAAPPAQVELRFAVMADADA